MLPERATLLVRERLPSARPTRRHIRDSPRQEEYIDLLGLMTDSCDIEYRRFEVVMMHAVASRFNVACHDIQAVS